MDNNALAHHGVIGMRWGVRRYQNKDGSLTKAGQRRQQKQREEALEKARTTKAANKQHEVDKQTAIKSGSASDVLKFKGELTPQEMQSAINRIRWEQDMKGIAAKDVAEGKSKTDKFFGGVDKATTNVNTALKAYNTVANIINAFSNSDISLPKVDTNITSGNRDQRKKEKKEAKKQEEAKKKREEQEAQRESKQKERAEKRAKESNDKVYSGTVEGTGTSSKKKSSSSHEKKAPDIIDADWYEVSVSDVPATTVSRGRSYVAGLLEAPKDDD
jgi:hypothetical protein